MSQATPVPYDCVRCPTECSPTQVPGAAGADGAAGAAGADGINAFTFLADGFVMPNIGSAVTVEVLDTSWMVPEQGSVYGQALAVEFAGTLLISNLIDATHVEITNLGYEGNAPGGTAIPSGGKVSPSGVQGPMSPPEAGALLAANNLSDLLDIPTAVSNLGLGSAALLPASAFFQVANNLSEGVAATIRTNIGLGTAAVEDTGIGDGDIAKNDGALTPGDVVFATADGQETKSAADAKAALGISGMVGNYVLCQDQGVSSGTFSNGSWVVVPVNTEVSDAGNIATLAANVLTLPTGAYRVRAVVLGYKVDSFQARLFNISDAAVEFYGTVAQADATGEGMDQSNVIGRLVVTSGPKNYRLEARCQTTCATNGFGLATGFGTDVFASWELEQEV